MAAILDHIHGAFHRRDHPAWPWIQGFVWTLIGLSILLVLGELTLYQGNEPAFVVLLDRVLLGIFAVEVSLRILSHRPAAARFYHLPLHARLRHEVVGRLRFALEPFNLIDILTLTAFHPALRGLRALRLLRLARTLPFFRYSNPLYGVVQAFRDNALLYLLAFAVLGSSVLLGGLSFFLVERDPNLSLFDSLWWAIVTLTTVGYGDISPQSGLGKVVAGVLMVVGMFTLALFAGVVGSTLLNAVLSIRQEQFRMTSTYNHVVVCGYAPGARMLLDAILSECDPTETELVIFSPGERPRDIPPEFRWVSGDPTKESELGKARLAEARAVVLVGERGLSPQDADARTILTLFTIRSLLRKGNTADARRQPLYLVAEILDAENVEHARAAGADEVIETTRLGFSLLSHTLVQRGTGDILSKITSAGAHSLYVGRIPHGLDLPMPFGELARLIKDQTGAMVIGLHDRDTDTDHLNPADHHPVPADARVVYLAEAPALEAG